ncbi:hypothetical protein WN944_005826 [Citrus x changshan-huyou]|uniref:Uncharacterized protein n=1 Tax=Citrus x changshan-huyou TaxID=2935761 RepID=A0AAP0QSL0_9ROSI
MEPEEETLATILEEEEDDDEGTAMPDVKNNCKIKTKGSSSDSSDASDADSDSDSEVEAKQNMELQSLRYMKVLRKMGEIEKLRQAREAMNEIFPLTPAMWQE